MGKKTENRTLELLENFFPQQRTEKNKNNSFIWFCYRAKSFVFI